MDYQIIILAAGKGSRMNSSLPKVMHQIQGTSMLERVFVNALSITDDIILVYSEILKPHLTPYEKVAKLALQQEPKGTAHAVSAALPYVDDKKAVAVIYADSPFISESTITSIFDHLQQTNSAAVTIAFECKSPNQYGRIVTEASGEFLKIVEFKKANLSEQDITLCNSGVMVFAPGILSKYLPVCLSSKGNDSDEFYLTDIIEVCKRHNENVSYLISPNFNELIGINTQDELDLANNITKSK